MPRSALQTAPDTCRCTQTHVHTITTITIVIIIIIIVISYELSDTMCVLASCLAEGLPVLLQASAGKGGSRAVYIAPKEELAKERFADWTQKFGSPGLGLNVCMLTGDPLADYAMLREANIVISTPEYWDMLSRRWRQPSRKEVQKVALFVVDELHLIGGANGPVLEVCLYLLG